MALTNHQKPGSYKQTGVVRVNGQFTSKAQQEALGLEPGTVDKPNSYVVKPAVKDSDFTEAFESNFLNKERLQNLARKPIAEGLTIAENVLKYGTGGIDIDGSRVEADMKTEDLERELFCNKNR